MNDSVCSDSPKSISFREENNEYDHNFETFYYTIDSQTFTIVRQEQSHNCFKDNIIVDLENELAGMKTRFAESINLFNQRKSAYMRIESEGAHMRNSSVASMNFMGNSYESKGEIDFFKKELEEAIDLIESMKEEHGKKIAELKSQIKDTQLVLEDFLNEMSSIKELLETKEIDISNLKKRIQESDKISEYLKEEVNSLKKVIKKKEMVECDKLLIEEKSRQSSNKIIELSNKLKLKEEELLKIKEKEKRVVPITPKSKHKAIHYNVESNTSASTLFKPHKNGPQIQSTLEDLLNIDEELEDLQALRTQPNFFKRAPTMPLIKNIFGSPPTDINQKGDAEDVTLRSIHNDLNNEFNEMLNQEDDYINLIINTEENIKSKSIICIVDSFLIPAQTQYAATKRLSVLEHLQTSSANKSSYISSICPLQIESMNSLIDYLKRDLETLKSENHLLKINYENRMIEIEEMYLTKLRSTRSHKSICTTKSTK